MQGPDASTGCTWVIGMSSVQFHLWRGNFMTHRHTRGMYVYMFIFIFAYLFMCVCMQNLWISEIYTSDIGVVHRCGQVIVVQFKYMNVILVLWHLTSRCILNNWEMFRSFLVLLVYSRSLPQACNDQNMIHVWVSPVGRSCFLMTTPPAFLLPRNQEARPKYARLSSSLAEHVSGRNCLNSCLESGVAEDIHQRWCHNAIPNADFDPEILVVCLLGGAFFSRRWGWRLNPTSKTPLWQICHTKEKT